MASLNALQAKAAKHNEGSALVLSGPGTGKTSTLIARTKFLVSKGVAIDDVFIATFTSKAAKEISSRLLTSIKSLTSVDDAELSLKNAYIGTFHSLCARLLKKFPGDAWLPHDFKILSDTDQLRILQRLGYEWDEDEGDIVELINNWKDQLISPEQMQQQSSQLANSFFQKATSAYKDYEDFKRKNGGIDFSDLISCATKVLQTNQEGADWFYSRFKHFIVDEFQDSNKNQISFLQTALKRGATIWAVADEDQSLYEWRGSSPAYCLNFSRIFSNSTVYKLEENYRCPPLVLNMAKAVIEKNKNRFTKNIYTNRAPSKSDLVVFKGNSDEKIEAEWIATQIKKLIEMKHVNLKDIAVLVRTSQSTTALQRVFDSKEINYQLVGTSSFWDLPEVVFFVKAVSKICEDIRLDDGKPFTNSKIGRSLNLLVDELKGSSLRQCANSISQILLDNIPPTLDTEKRETWLHSVESVANLALDVDDAQSFIDLVIDKREKASKKPEDCVVISSLHSSKGLEWKFVFIAGAEEQLMPHFKNNNLEEERRLFYVGMTRAKSKLFVTYSYKRNNKSKKPSRFLFEAKKGINKNLGKFSWLDTNENLNKKTQAQENKTSPVVRVGKSMFKYKGGKSLIPPDERGK